MTATPGPGPGPGRPALAALLAGLQDALRALFVQRAEAVARRRRLLQRRLLFGLELLCKIEEQVLLPALQQAEPGWAGDIALTAREIELLRDLSQLVSQTTAGHREVSAGVLEGMALLHFARIDGLLQRPGARAVDWPALQHEVQGLLVRWHAEVQAHGQIEDEERDPVGLPPR